MIYIEAIIDNEKHIPLAEWDAQSFSDTQKLKVQARDVVAIKDIFNKFKTLDIAINSEIKASFSEYDSYSSISYLGEIFIEGEKFFAECFEVGLKSQSLIDIVTKLDEQINPVVDIDSMTADEYRTYLKKELSKICTSEIFAGADVKLSDGSIEHFSYDQYDQANLASCFVMAQLGTPYIPYHADAMVCRLFSAVDIFYIYGTCQLKLTTLTTKYNFLTQWMGTINDKETLLGITWDTHLPEEYQSQMDTIVNTSREIMEEIGKKFIPTSDVSETNE
jgi:hypothetical protein